jgi:hypothetical protein
MMPSTDNLDDIDAYIQSQSSGGSSGLFDWNILRTGRILFPRLQQKKRVGLSFFLFTNNILVLVK